MFNIFRKDDGQDVEVDVVAEEGKSPDNQVECREIINRWVQESEDEEDLETTKRSDYYFRKQK